MNTSHLAFVILTYVLGVQAMNSLFGSRHYKSADVRCIKTNCEVLFRELTGIIAAGTNNSINGPINALDDLNNNVEAYFSKSNLKNYIISYMDIYKDNIISFLEVSKVEGFVREIKSSIKKYQSNIKECRLPGGDPLKDYISGFLSDIKTAFKKDIPPQQPSSEEGPSSSYQPEPYNTINYPPQNFGYGYGPGYDYSGYGNPSSYQSDDQYSQASARYSFDSSGRIDYPFADPDNLGDGR